MPKQTFWNLPEDKRERFARIALEEFADNDYASASVSRIVTRAGIAKGSVYQYFADKQDLFLYLLDRAQRTLLATVAGGNAPPGPQESSSGFFTVLRAQMDATVRVGAAHPLESRLLGRAYASSLPFHDEVLERGRALRQVYLQRMVEEAVARGELSPLLDAGVATMVIESVVAGIGPFLLKRLAPDLASPVEVDPSVFEDPEVEQVFNQVVAILHRGMGAPGDANPALGAEK